jgi:hypothetical protein
MPTSDVCNLPFNKVAAGLKCSGGLLFSDGKSGSGFRFGKTMKQSILATELEL